MYTPVENLLVEIEAANIGALLDLQIRDAGSLPVWLPRPTDEEIRVSIDMAMTRQFSKDAAAHRMETAG